MEFPDIVGFFFCLERHLLLIRSPEPGWTILTQDQKKDKQKLA